MVRKSLWIFLTFVFLASGVNLISAQPLIDPESPGFSGETRDKNYDSLLNALYNGDAVQTIGERLWVPWFSTSSSCTVADLHKGDSCNSGTVIDSTRNCMVSDEFSQVGLVLSMGKDQIRMNKFFNTVKAIPSKYGKLLSWRVFRNGAIIEACRPGINGNCDSASDADARTIIALYTASANPHFSDEIKKAEYKKFADEMAADFVKYNVLYSCKQSSLGQGNICYWLAAGGDAKSGGMASTDFGYTGYYGDSIIAMLQACSNTGDQKYCKVADDLTLNYLEAAKYDRTKFTTPPGRSFKWTNLAGIPRAECTHTCYPVQWDYADASRAVGICQANYYASLIDHKLPLLEGYCDKWGNTYMNDPGKAPIQYFPDGRAVNYQSGYFAQGLQSLFQMGGHNEELFKPTLDNALAHYAPSKGTWDYTQCFGVYMQSFAVRALGTGLGRDLESFGGEPIPNPGSVGGKKVPAPIDYYETSCTYDSKGCNLVSDETAGDCRTIVYSTSAGNIQMLTCRKPGDMVEVYRQAHPSTGTFRACVHTGCVDQMQGFASFPAVMQEIKISLMMDCKTSGSC